MKTKTYTKHKKNTKKPDITGAEWKTLEEIRQHKKETQLDRIERKLDELLSWPAVTPPGQWVVPYPCDPMPIGPVDPSWPTTRTDRPVRYPVGPFGDPIPYA